VKALCDVIVHQRQRGENRQRRAEGQGPAVRAGRKSRPVGDGADGPPMTLWKGNCYAHVEFQREQVLRRSGKFPDAKMVVHPESLREVRDLADAVCSTEKMITYCKTSPAKRFVIVTESGIIHRMQKECPGKEFLCAPTFDVMRAPDGQLPLQRVQIHEDEHARKGARLHEKPRAAHRAAGGNHETRAPAD
jgi:quinolinate synthase